MRKLRPIVNSRSNSMRMMSLICIFVISLLGHRAFGGVVTVKSTASGGTAVGTTTGSDWQIRQASPHFWFTQADVRFGHPAFGGPYTRSAPSAFGRKTVAGLTTRTSGVVADPDGSGANGFSEATVNSSPGIAIISYTYQLNAISTAVSLPTVHNTQTIARLVDPIGLQVGSAGTSIGYSSYLSEGTQVQRGMDLPPLMIEGRFGLGDYSEDPSGFWSDLPPADTFNLFSIEVYENSSGAIDATVSYFSPSADFALQFSQTAADLTETIRTASWLSIDGFWVLQQDLSLGEILITSLNAANHNANATIGTRISTAATAVIPEPSSLTLLGIAIVSITLVATARMRVSNL